MLQERSNGSKRKVPDSSYIPGHNPVYSRTINHQHTNSLPVDPGLIHPHSVPLGANHGSVNNLIDSNQYLSPSKSTYNHQFSSPTSSNHLIKQEYNPSGQIQQIKTEPMHQPVAMQSNVLKNQLYAHPRFNSNSHSRHLSLPVEMPPTNNLCDSQYTGYRSHQQPMGSVEEIPLPEGWSSEKTSTGQIYFINHVAQTTTWDDPRKQFNNGMRPNEACPDIKSIVRTMPLPPGWEECESANGELYYINHNAQTTHWEDPRIEIYMQQNKAYSNQYREPGFASSTSSLSSSIGSISTSSSIQSLNTLSINNFGAANKQPNQPLSTMTSQYNNAANTNPGVNKTSSKSNKDIIRNLQQSLDQVLKQKNTILQQIDLLSQRESTLKLRLTQPELDDVLFSLKNQNSKMLGFNRYDQTSKVANESVNEMDNTLINNENNTLASEPQNVI